MSVLLKSTSGYFGLLLLCLQRRLSQLSEDIEIINGILQCFQMHVYGEFFCGKIASAVLVPVDTG